MSLQDVIHLSRLSGTSSNGALPTSYENLWEDPGHKESDISPEISKPPDDDTATGFYGLSTCIKSPSDVDMWVSTPPSSGKSSGFIVLKWNISPISQHEEPQLSYTLTTDQQKMVDQSTWWNVDRILQQRDFTTAYIKWHRPYASPETLKDSQKRKISERFAVLAQREDDWDERGSKKPTQPILVYAERLIVELHDTITSAGHEWLTPFISSDEDGYITVSWYKEKRTLHIEIEENEAEYTKISRINNNIKMEADFLDCNIYLTLWKWLLDE